MCSVKVELKNFKIKRLKMIQFFSKKRGEKGFTLIELLVVIAIIGILAGIVLVALGGARTRAQDARIQAEMTQIRTIGEIFFSGVSPNSYTGLCADADVTTLQADILAQGGTGFSCLVATGAIGEPAAGTAYCVEVQLNSNQFWCVDSLLRSAQYGASPITCAVGAAHTCQ